MNENLLPWYNSVEAAAFYVFILLAAILVFGAVYAVFNAFRNEHGNPFDKNHTKNQ